MFPIAYELIRSDAFRSLSKHETDIFLFALSERQYPGRKQRTSFNYWKPLNERHFVLPYRNMAKFYHMKKVKPPTESTFRRSINKMMTVGFISLVEMGGAGVGSMNIYRLENNWRTWKKGQKACFVKAGMSKKKGFCIPGSRKFCPTKR